MYSSQTPVSDGAAVATQSDDFWWDDAMLASSLELATFRSWLCERQAEDRRGRAIAGYHGASQCCPLASYLQHSMFDGNLWIEGNTVTWHAPDSSRRVTLAHLPDWAIAFVHALGPERRLVTVEECLTVLLWISKKMQAGVTISLEDEYVHRLSAHPQAGRAERTA